jgi:hypothetical protein
LEVFDHAIWYCKLRLYGRFFVVEQLKETPELNDVLAVTINLGMVPLPWQLYDPPNGLNYLVHQLQSGLVAASTVSAVDPGSKNKEDICLEHLGAALVAGGTS